MTRPASSPKPRRGSSRQRTWSSPPDLTSVPQRRRYCRERAAYSRCMPAATAKNPDQLPDRAVLVVGGGSSGAQIAEELMRAGRRVYLSVSKHRRRPRRYRGRVITWWWTETGALNLPVEQRGRDQSPMVFTGAYGGHTIDFRRFALEGMVLLGRTEAVQNDVMFFAPDLLLSLSHGHAAYRSMLGFSSMHMPWMPA